MVDGIKKERFCLLFPSCLVVMSATANMNGYIFQVSGSLHYLEGEVGVQGFLFLFEFFCEQSKWN